MAKRLLVTGLLLLALAAIVWFGFLRTDTKPNAFAGWQQTVSVVTEQAKQADVPIILDGIGTVKAFQTVTVRPKVDGELLKLRFSNGQMVEQGDVLAEIDPVLYQADLDEALGQLKTDQAQLASAEKDLNRYQQLAKNNYASQQQLDQTQSEVNQLKARIQSDQAAVARAQKKLDDTQVKAPITGRTGIRQVDVGNVVSPNDESGLVVLTQTQPITIDFTLAARYLPQIIAGQVTGQLPITVWDTRNVNKLASGQVSVVDNQINIETGTIALQAHVANEDNLLWPGQFVNVQLQVGIQKNAITVPVSAIQQGPDGAFVYLIDEDNKARIHRVEVTRQDEHLAVVAQGLEAGETVITAGFTNLADGTEVVVADDNATQD